MNKKFLGFVSAAAIGLASLAPINAHAVPVALELILLVDVSGSVDATEYDLQKQGYVNAFNDADHSGEHRIAALGGIAVTYIEWSSAGTSRSAAGGLDADHGRGQRRCVCDRDCRDKPSVQRPNGPGQCDQLRRPAVHQQRL